MMANAWNISNARFVFAFALLKKMCYNYFRVEKKIYCLFERCFSHDNAILLRVGICDGGEGGLF